jgi:hypothetical protein
MEDNYIEEVLKEVKEIYDSKTPEELNELDWF